MRNLIIVVLTLLALIQSAMIVQKERGSQKWEQAATPIFNAYNPSVVRDPGTLEHILKYAQPPGQKQAQRGPRYGDCVPLKWD